VPGAPKSGRAGYTRSRLEDHRKACGKIGVAPDARAWLDGWVAGKTRYCTPLEAWRQGLDGRLYLGACANHPDEAEIVNRQDLGWKLREAREKASLNRLGISMAETELGTAKTEAERRQVRERLRTLELERRVLIVVMERLEQAEPAR
jgi:hypothetical protein